MTVDQIKREARTEFAAGVKTMRQLYEAVERDRARFAELSELWNELAIAEQDAILATARRYAETETL